ncbi:vacuolar protein sorting-associated protein 52 homolog, partial [Corapipo altera]|uniref:vacuolar protein sorting-associated protein 52 homolog n=1 Tax=Corapipo altera TaxID=415028 RepID=UPI000FD69B7D
MIGVILEVPVTEPEFLEQLRELNGKIEAVKEQAFRDTLACADVQHVLEKLKVKVGTPPGFLGMLGIPGNGWNSKEWLEFQGMAGIPRNGQDSKENPKNQWEGTG